MSNATVTNGTKFFRGDGGTGPGAATETGQTGTGNGVMGAITVSAGAKVGAYVLAIIAAAANAGTFKVTDPTGVIIGTGTVAVAFSAGGLAFTLADGSADFVVGDTRTITVTSTSSEVFTEVIEVVSITPGTPTAPSIPVTHLMSARQEKRGGLPDVGTMTVTLNHLPTDAQHVAMNAEQGTNVSRNYRVMYPGFVSVSDHNGGKLFSLVLTSYGLSEIEIDGVYRAIATFEVNSVSEIAAV